MAKYIDAEKLKRTLIDKYSFLPAFVVRAIEEAPVADVVSRETHEAVQKALIAFAETDVVQVVRCKNCNHYIAGFCTRDINGRTNMFLMSENDFCSHGERKTDNV